MLRSILLYALCSMLYLIPGLGADERVFQFLDLDDLPHQIIRWEIPAPDESMDSYVNKLIKQIDPTQRIELLGLSFGGIIAQEIALRVPCPRLILISGIYHPLELRFGIRLIRRLNLLKWISGDWLKRLGRRFAWYAFAPLNREERKLLDAILADTDPTFLKWAANQVLTWQGADVEGALVRVHGTKDRIFPVSRVPSAVLVQGGGHFMIVSHAHEISEWIRGDWAT